MGHRISLRKGNGSTEIAARIKLSWALYDKLSYILNLINSKGKVHNSCVLPVGTYGMDTSALTQRNVCKLLVMERAMEKLMLGLWK